MNDEFESYYDGIPKEVSDRHLKMSDEEFELELKREEEKCQKLNA